LRLPWGYAAALGANCVGMVRIGIGSAAEATQKAITRLLCVLDLQRLMLVRVVCEPAAVRWLWLESPLMDARWLALRRAVVAAPRALQAQQNHSLPE
jgi:hypothetical protein